MQDISMRSGWVLKSFNIFFYFWVESLPSSVRSGKMIAGWTTVLNQDIHGSNHHNLDDIRPERIKLDEFSKHLIGKYHYIAEDIKDLIVDNMSRHWDETIRVI